MDPFSLTCGVVGLVDTGLNVAKELKEKIDLFRSAERDIMDLAHEVDLCTTLLDVFGNSLDRPENAYPRNVVKQTKRLVLDMRTIFTEIEVLVAEFDASAKASAKYIVNAGALREQHSKLKGLQLSFVFMLSVCPPKPPAPPAPVVGANSAGVFGGPGGSFEGTIQHMPIYSNDRGSPNGAPITYKATLVLQPSQPPQAAPGVACGEAAGSVSATDLTEQLDELRKNQRLKKKLANLTSNPFFSKDLFGDMFRSSKATKVESRTYGLEVPVIGHDAGDSPGIRFREDETRRKEDAVMRKKSKVYEKLEWEGVPTSRMSRSSDEQEFTMRSEARSATDVDDILSYLFDDKGAEEDKDTASGADPIDYQATEVRLPPAENRKAQPPRQKSPGGGPNTFAEPIVQPRPSPAPRRRSPQPSTSQQSAPDSSNRGPDTLKRSSRYTCDGCERKIEDERRYQCTDCKDFDFCMTCYRDPERTIRHPHPKSHFKTIEPDLQERY